MRSKYTEWTIDGGEDVLTSATGSLTVRVRFDLGIQPGCVSVPHGWGDTNVNHLISSRLDIEPLTGMPRSSGTVVSLAQAETTRLIL